MNYLDAKAFTELFQNPEANHAEICIGQASIAAGVSRRFWFARAVDRREATSIATIACIERIDRFNFGKGADAFSYFSTVAYRAFLKSLVSNARRSRRATLFADLNVSPSASIDGDDGRESVIDGATHYYSIR